MRRAVTTGTLAVLVLSVTGGYVVFDGDTPVRDGLCLPDHHGGADHHDDGPPPCEATLAFGGDILIHSGVWEAADTGAGYDFSPMLAPIAPRLSAADLAICHLEVTLARPGEACRATHGSGRRASWRPTWPRPGSTAARWRPTTRSTSASRGWWRRSTPSTPPAWPTPAPLAAEDRRPAVYDAGGIARRPAVLRLRVQRLRAAAPARSGSSTRSTRR